MKNGIRMARQRKGISQAELARLINANRQTVFKLERGERKLSVEWAERIATALGCTPQELMFPETAKLDLSHFHNIWSLLDEDQTVDPPLNFSADLLADLLPRAADHQIRYVSVEDDEMRNHFARGDLIIVDCDDRSPSRAGIFAVKIGDALQWRHLSPLAEQGAFQMSADDPKIPTERVSDGTVEIVGRARLKITPV